MTMATPSLPLQPMTSAVRFTYLSLRRLHRPDAARVARCIGTPTWDAATVRRKLLPLLIEWDAQV